MASDTDRQDSDTRVAGFLLVAAFLTTLILFAYHPAEGAAANFAAILRNEAKDAPTDAVVHGGFIAVMTIELVCFARLAMLLGLRRMLPLAGLIFTAAGFAVLSASMVLDGFVAPAIAKRFVGATAGLEAAHTLYIFCGTAIGFLMPIGLLFQASGIGAWSFALAFRPAYARAVGLLGISLAGLLVVGIAAGRGNPLVLMAGLLATAVWALAVGILLAARKA